MTHTIGFVLISLGVVVFAVVIKNYIDIFIFIKAHKGQKISLTYRSSPYIISVILIMAGIGMMIFA